MKSLVIFLGLGLGALALGGCSPSNSGNAAASGGNAPANANAAAPSASGTPASGGPVSSVWVPGSDDKLHLRPVSKAAQDARRGGNSTAALGEIVRQAPAWFPPKTRVLDVHDDGKTIAVNLSREFASSTFWSKKGERTTELAVYALVNSASQGGKSVALQVEKRAISAEKLNGFDASDAIEPDPKLQVGAAPSSGSAAPTEASAP